MTEQVAAADEGIEVLMPEGAADVTPNNNNNKTTVMVDDENEDAHHHPVLLDASNHSKNNTTTTQTAVEHTNKEAVAATPKESSSSSSSNSDGNKDDSENLPFATAPSTSDAAAADHDADDEAGVEVDYDLSVVVMEESSSNLGDKKDKQEGIDSSIIIAREEDEEENVGAGTTGAASTETPSSDIHVVEEEENRTNTPETKPTPTEEDEEPTELEKQEEKEASTTSTTTTDQVVEAPDESVPPAQEKEETAVAPGNTGEDKDAAVDDGQNNVIQEPLPTEPSAETAQSSPPPGESNKVTLSFDENVQSPATTTSTDRMAKQPAASDSVAEEEKEEVDAEKESAPLESSSPPTAKVVEEPRRKDAEVATEKSPSSSAPEDEKEENAAEEQPTPAMDSSKDPAATAPVVEGPTETTPPPSEATIAVQEEGEAPTETETPEEATPPPEATAPQEVDEGGDFTTNKVLFLPTKSKYAKIQASKDKELDAIRQRAVAKEKNQTFTKLQETSSMQAELQNMLDEDLQRRKANPKKFDTSTTSGGGTNPNMLSPYEVLRAQQTKDKQEARQKEKDTLQQASTHSSTGCNHNAAAMLSPYEVLRMQQTKDKQDARQKEKDTLQQQHQTRRHSDVISPLDALRLQQNKQKQQARQKEKETQQQSQRRHSDFISPLDALRLQQNKQKQEARQKEKDTLLQYQQHSLKSSIESHYNNPESLSSDETVHRADGDTSVNVDSTIKVLNGESEKDDPVENSVPPPPPKVIGKLPKMDFTSSAGSKPRTSSQRELDEIGKQGLAKARSQHFTEYQKTNAEQKAFHDAMKHDLEQRKAGQGGTSITTAAMIAASPRLSGAGGMVSPKIAETFIQTTAAAASSSEQKKKEIRNKELEDLEKLRQQGLAKARSQQYVEFEQRSSEQQAAYEAGARDLEQRKKGTSEFVFSPNKDISPVDAVYLDHHKWKKDTMKQDRQALGYFDSHPDAAEQQQKETMKKDALAAVPGSGSHASKPNSNPPPTTPNDPADAGVSQGCDACGACIIL